MYEYDIKEVVKICNYLLNKYPNARIYISASYDGSLSAEIHDDTNQTMDVVHFDYLNIDE